MQTKSISTRSVQFNTGKWASKTRKKIKISERRADKHLSIVENIYSLDKQIKRNEKAAEYEWELIETQ